MICGVEVIRRIRSWSQIPIIVISARSEDADKIEALDAGADDYLTKPFSVAELLARLRATQRRLAVLNSSNGDALFHNGRLTIDYAAGCAYLRKLLGKRHGISAGPYGNTPQESRKRPGC